MLNRFDPGSEVSKINSSNKALIEVSEECFAIIDQCLTLNQLTNHFFDVCIQESHSPGTPHFILDKEKQTIQPLHANLHFDFGGFAKGYALEEIRTILSKAGVADALVNFGNSSILALGHHPHGDCWEVSLQHSFKPELSVSTFRLLNQVLTTSGILSTQKAHIRSPHTGQLCTANETYSVVTASATEGEAISTALYAANQEMLQKVILQNFKLKTALRVSYANDDFAVKVITV